MTRAVSDTGPLISAFQSDSFGLLTTIFAEVVIPDLCRTELEQHGWNDELRAASDHLRTVALRAGEESLAIRFAEQIAEDPVSKSQVVDHHLGEARAIALALRDEHRDDVLLLDELAARQVAVRAGVTISGFPGALLLAARAGLITPREVRSRLETCRRQGTHYGASLIEQVYDMARGSRR